MTTIHTSMTVSSDPTLALIGWAAVRRGKVLHILVSDTLSARQQAKARLCAMTDSEYGDSVLPLQRTPAAIDLAAV